MNKSQVEDVKNFPKKFRLLVQKISQNQPLTIYTLNRFHVSVRSFASGFFPEFRNSYSSGMNSALLFGQLADLAKK